MTMTTVETHDETNLGLVPSGLPAWPVLTMLWGFPLWWATGMTVIMASVLTGVMLAYLLIGRRVPILPGMGVLVAFLLWVLACVTMIDSVERLLGYLYRTSILIFVATAFVYTICAAGQLTRRRVIAALTFVWFFTIGGGLAALAFPEVRLTTPVGLLLPDTIRSNEYVRDLFFPPMAEIQRPYGSPEHTLASASTYFSDLKAQGIVVDLKARRAAIEAQVTALWKMMRACEPPH